MSTGLHVPFSNGLDVHGKDRKEMKALYLFKIFRIGSQNVITTQVMAWGMWKIQRSVSVRPFVVHADHSNDKAAMERNTPRRNISIGIQHQTEAQTKGETLMSDTQPARQGIGRVRVL